MDSQPVIQESKISYTIKDVLEECAAIISYQTNSIQIEKVKL